MINFSMWGKALKTIPRLSREEWEQLDVVSRWLVSTRAAVLLMTAMSGLLGGLFVYYMGYSFDWVNYILVVIGLCFAHAANNLLNDYTDFKRGVDKGNYYRSMYGPQPLEHGLMTVRQHAVYFFVTLAIAAACGVALIFRTDIGTLYLMLLGAFFLLFYTWPLKYFALGEPTVLIVWGPLMVGGSFYVVSGGVWNWSVALIGLAYAIGPTLVLFGKHIDKRLEDKKKKIYTLPVVLGEKGARYTAIALMALQYAAIVFFIIKGALGWPLLMVALSIPKFIKTARVFSQPRPTEEPAGLPPGVWPLYLSANAFVYNKSFSMMFLLGLIIDTILVKMNILPF